MALRISQQFALVAIYHPLLLCRCSFGIFHGTGDNRDWSFVMTAVRTNSYGFFFCLGSFDIFNEFLCGQFAKLLVDFNYCGLGATFFIKCSDKRNNLYSATIFFFFCVNFTVNLNYFLRVPRMNCARS